VPPGADDPGRRARHREPVEGNLTHVVQLYDAGTEVDQPIGFGSNQAPRQAGPNTGLAEGGVVHMVT
jgi:hypothetical protein